MEIKGFKAFAVDGTNVNGITMEAGKKYHIDGAIKYGTQGNGYHFALHLEDTIRFAADTLPGDCLIAEVIGSGEIVEGWDDYYGYYDLYSCSDLEVIRYLSREEILDYATKLSDIKMKRFIECFKLNDDEIELFSGRGHIVDLAIDYYQRDMKDAYDPENVLKKLLK